MDALHLTIERDGDQTTIAGTPTSLRLLRSAIDAALERGSATCATPAMHEVLVEREDG